MNRRGGDVTLVHLPDSAFGQHALSVLRPEQPEIADLMSDFLAKKGLD